jgi:hypothetical protein
MGSTKKHAEQDAARRALERLQAAQVKAGASPSAKPEAEGEESPEQ